ncbi:MAG TPA: SDR family NAD(P)-dependent oxidoreductase, partial [Anseongella sp.]|nr:SDR family NAD(P)-dependent oxidoreductase [Anseongella sp.]
MNVVITGGSKGIGRATAIAFAEQQAQVAVCARHAGQLEDLGRELEKINPRVNYIGFPADCSKKNELLEF